MNTFTNSVVKGSGFVLSRAEGDYFYNIVKDEMAAPHSGILGRVYKDSVEGNYVVKLFNKKYTLPDFNKVRTFLKEALAA